MNLNIDGDCEYYITKEYGPNNEDLTVDLLTEFFVIVYTFIKKGSKTPEEHYTFTLDFEQALKRYKLLPNCKCLLKRFLTDDPALIELATTGTKPKVVMSEDLNSEETTVAIKEIMDRYNDDDVDRSAITVRELTDEEFDFLRLESEKIKTISVDDNDRTVTPSKDNAHRKATA